jgi:hypothetical protein
MSAEIAPDMGQRREVDGCLSQAAVEALNARGHRVEVVGPWGIRNGLPPFL